MGQSSFGGRRAAIVGLTLLALPQPGVADAVTEVRCALAEGERHLAEAKDAARLLAEGHAAMFAAPEDWTCETANQPEIGTDAARLDAEFLCQRSSTNARVTIGGADGVEDMKRLVGQATPKTFRRNQLLFARGPWELATKDGELLGVLGDVATVRVVSSTDIPLREDDFVGFIESLNRLNQKLPDLASAEDRYSKAITANASGAPEINDDVRQALKALPSFLSFDDLGFEKVKDDKQDKTNLLIGAGGFTRTLPWAIVILAATADEKELTPELAKGLQACSSGNSQAVSPGTCLTHNGYTYWFGLEESDMPEIKTSSAIVPIGKRMVMAFVTFGPAQGVRSDPEFEKFLDKHEKTESLEDIGEALVDLVGMISFKNDPDNLPVTVNKILDEFDAQGLDRLDIDRYPVDSSECSRTGP